MNGIKMSDCKFYVDEAARTVVCVIADTEDYCVKDLVIDFINDHFGFSDLDFEYLTTWRMKDKLELPRSFMGKAVCAPEDNWDEDLGKMIAFSRAKDKCYKSFFRRANKFVQAIDRRLGDMITTFNDFGVRLEDKREGLQQRIDELTGVTAEEEE